MTISRDTKSWPHAWEEVTDDDQRRLFVEELQKEVSEGHVLWGRVVNLIARRRDADDILVQLLGPESLYAQVHLTWSSRPENNPKWPRTATFSSLKEWRDQLIPA